MIDLSMEEFLLWVIGVPMVIIGLVAVGRSMKHRARKRSLRREIVRCRVCGYLYKDKTRERYCECPVCSSMNERGEARRLG